jgi:hypothetical protein
MFLSSITVFILVLNIASQHIYQLFLTNVKKYVFGKTINVELAQLLQMSLSNHNCQVMILL